MNIVTYLINLDDSTDRLATATQSLRVAHMDFERVPAYDARQKNPLEIPGYDEQRALGYMGRKLKGGELGCYMSHLDCVRRFLTTDADYAVVLEDDMTIAASDAKQVIQDALAWLQAQHFVIQYIAFVYMHIRYCIICFTVVFIFCFIKYPFRIRSIIFLYFFII